MKQYSIVHQNKYGVAGVACKSDDDDVEVPDIPDDDESNPDKSKKQKERYRASYIPLVGSVLHNYLGGIRKKVRYQDGILLSQIRKGCKWIPPPFDPLSIRIGASPKPDKW